MITFPSPTTVERSCELSDEATNPRPRPAPRTVLICHADDVLNREGLARWLGATTELAAVIVLDEPPSRMRQRVRREIRRVGWFRFLDVLAFRVYYKLFLSRQDRAWEQLMLSRLCDRFPALTGSTEILQAPSPNSPEVQQLLTCLAPDLVIARCKTLIKPEVYSIPRQGTLVMHPGICPQYRNAHGCFWALAQADEANVGMTLLKIDRGVDTGPVYGYFRCDFDPLRESHHVIQHRVVFDNLDALGRMLTSIHQGTARPVPTAGLPSAEWGQPWLSSYWKIRRRAHASKVRRAPVAPSLPTE